MIFRSRGHRAKFAFALREATRSTPMMPPDRFALSRHAIFFLFVLLGIPGAARSATLEDAAKELARKIATALPSQENLSCKIDNASTLKPEDVARISQLVTGEFQSEGVHVSTAGDAAVNVVITLSENWKELVWTAVIRKGDESRAVLLAVPRPAENQAASSAMPATIRSERFWEGPEHVLDVARISGTDGKPWLALLLRDKVVIQEPTGGLEIPFEPPAMRDPWGKLEPGPNGPTIAISLPSRKCTVDVDARRLVECVPEEADLSRTTASRDPLTIDLLPPGPPPPGKGLGLVTAPVCGGADQFLATSARDYTQTDSLQVFESEPRGPVAMSGELDFPGPIVALHIALDAPRAIVRNLTTGNYEAYRLYISCGR
jgi:hypothetical protein